MEFLLCTTLVFMFLSLIFAVLVYCIFRQINIHFFAYKQMVDELNEKISELSKGREQMEDTLQSVIELCIAWGFGLGFTSFLVGHAFSVLMAFFKSL